MKDNDYMNNRTRPFPNKWYYFLAKGKNVKSSTQVPSPYRPFLNYCM